MRVIMLSDERIRQIAESHIWRLINIDGLVIRTDAELACDDSIRAALAEAAQSPAVPVMGELTDRQLFNVAFNLSAEFGPEFTQANKAFAMAVIEQYRHAMSNTTIMQAELDAPKEGE